MTVPNLDEFYPVPKIITIAAALAEARIPYAFGGALVLIYWGEIRATKDIDINIFLPESGVDEVFEAVHSVGVTGDWDEARQEVDVTGQVRLGWNGTPLDLFFAYDPFHESCARRTTEEDFAGVTIPVLSAEDVVVFKTLFNRPKDWGDIEAILAVQGSTFDCGYALEWLTRILGPGDSALERLRSLVDEYRDDPA